MNLDILIDSAIKKYGKRTAVFDKDRKLSFTDLGVRTNRLGAALASMGLECGSRIASLQNNAIEAIETDVMAARFGYARTLLNARYSETDHEYCINHCEARVLIFGAEFTEMVASLRDKLPKVEAYIVVGDGPSWALNYEELLSQHDDAPAPWSVQEDDVHSIYYTSGTTGQPKGVILSQKNWIVLVRNHLTGPFSNIKQEDVLLHSAPLSHASGCMVIPHLMRGASQCIMKKFDATTILDLIQSESITTMFLAPTMISMILDAPGSKDYNTRSLHSVIYGGAPMAVETIRETIARWGPVLIQGYGQWEAPQMVCFLSQEEHAEALGDPALIHRLASTGQALPFLKMGIMDDEGNLLGADQEGEVVSKGDHLMVGYLNNQEATDEIRVGEWQRSGDIGRIDKDGFVYLTDRKKDIIITGGSNVYPREIEEVLYTHPDVSECVAFGVPNDKWGETVHALAIPRTGHEINEEEFLEWCKDRLPNDKRPRSMGVVDHLPKSAYGKILRREIRLTFWEGRDRKV